MSKETEVCDACMSWLTLYQASTAFLSHVGLKMVRNTVCIEYSQGGFTMLCVYVRPNPFYNLTDSISIPVKVHTGCIRFCQRSHFVTLLYNVYVRSCVLSVSSMWSSTLGPWTLWVVTTFTSSCTLNSGGLLWLQVVVYLAVPDTRADYRCAILL